MYCLDCKEELKSIEIGDHLNHRLAGWETYNRVKKDSFTGWLVVLPLGILLGVMALLWVTVRN